MFRQQINRSTLLQQIKEYLLQSTIEEYLDILLHHTEYLLQSTIQEYLRVVPLQQHVPLFHSLLDVIKHSHRRATVEASALLNTTHIYI